jgi:MarR family transcriptional regulator, organic hydroperoxide resistance regulator
VATTYPQLELDNQLCFALYSASRAIVRAYGPLLADAELTYPQYLTMMVLWETPDEAQAVGALGARLHLDSGTLTPLLKRLEQSGNIRRRRDPADERRVLIELTPQGLALRDRVAGVPAQVVGQLDLGREQAVRLLGDLRSLVATLEAVEP